MIDISKAIRIITRETPKLGNEKCLLSESVNRILNEDIVADTDLPPFDRSQMDGFAVIAADTIQKPAMQKPARGKGISLKIVGESAAGKGWHETMKSGEAVAIMTGAPLPTGADAVQKIELTNSKDWGQSGVVEILEPVKIGSFIVRRGSEIKKGQTIFKSGEVVTENLIAALAAFGYSKVKTAKKPRIAILGTGSEIVEINKRPGRDQIRNSNSVMLEVLSRRHGAETTVFPIARDDISNLKSQISDAVGRGDTNAKNHRPDLLVITGGVSVGKYDHTKAALLELGAEIFFDKVRLKPGKPTVFGRLGKTLVFGLPGNPVSAAVTFHLFVRSAILRMQSATKTELRKGFAIAAADVKAARERDTYLPSRLETDESGRLVAHPLKWQGSSDFVGFAMADSLIFVPKSEMIKAGDVAEIVYL